ncbi:MAG: heme-binding protein [Burkholderiales bacterium]|nr:heme-binding protein [Burkholderiales bacterium]
MHTPAKTHIAASISQDAALQLIAAAREACANLGIEVAIAVTDAAGHLKAFERSDHARFLTADVAIDKAWTAASFGLGTHVWSQIISNPDVAQLAHRPRLVAVGGGYPILLEGQVVGGIGISGGNALQDQQACEAALVATGFELAR